MRHLLLLMIAGAALCQAPKAPDRTDKVANGRFWKALSNEGRLYYVIGFSDGVVSSSLEAIATYIPNATYGETVEAIDRFFAEPENAAIPVRDAVRVFRMKLNGASPERIEEEKAAIRRAVQEQERIDRKQQ